jgi:uncharacterized repeat protein (TIGR03803 family)
MGLLRTLLAATLLAVAGCSQSVTLYSFSGSSDGESPSGSLIADAAGNFYGVTYGGGTAGYGTAFQLTPSLTLNPLHHFDLTKLDPTDGANPYGALVADASGNLYGTTSWGGSNPGCSAALGCGTVFQVTRSGGGFGVLHRFTSDEGAHPYAGLIIDAAGNLYGTTYQGGDFTSCPPVGCGTVFQLTPSGQLFVLHRFNGSDGREPRAGLLRGAAGLYGTTSRGGGAGDGGTVFLLTVEKQRDPRRYEVVPAMTLIVLHSFVDDKSQPRYPEAGLIADAAGNLYGTTTEGGTGDAGTVFQLTPSGTLNVLHSFNFDRSEGVVPEAGVIFDASGNWPGSLYGTTSGL